MKSLIKIYLTLILFLLIFQCKNSDKENALLLAGASLIIAQELEAQSLMSGPVLIDQETELTNYQFKFYNSTQKLTLEAYFSKPAGMGPFPLIVMMHGCAGAHSNSDASKPPSSLYTEWASRGKTLGYATLLIDSFTPRNAPQNQCSNGAGVGTSEVTDRPTDAYAALAYVKRSKVVNNDRIVLLGWSHGGSSVFATVDTNSTLQYRSENQRPFKAVISFYPGCGLNNAFGGISNSQYLPYTHIKILAAGADPLYTGGYCNTRVSRAQTLGASSATNNLIAMTVYPNTHHSFDEAKAVSSKFDANDVAAKPNADQEAVNFFQLYNP
ncbi:dienelactone hydrolase family protein [Leptospira interrogans]|uniref:dienelactone hydrolase family protein n=1 Tax=Leptospira interrogans TaxID=173 RepID=UPI0002BC14BF|nr:dienelactone hydrolase family protein [Leptospira interrogans]EMN70746.1 dienelactone hydrolase family protein [Leptospira interrogans serovar Bataviae str. UI 08561]EMO92086.1 dienelactone hydrolase family protein [Leptospira interrogans str. UI 13372]